MMNISSAFNRSAWYPRAYGVCSHSMLARRSRAFKNKGFRTEDLLKGRARKQNPPICNHCINRNQSSERCFIIWRLRVIHDKLRSLPDSDIAYISYALVIPITREEFTRWLPSATQNTWVQQEELINKREEGGKKSNILSLSRSKQLHLQKSEFVGIVSVCSVGFFPFE